MAIGESAGILFKIKADADDAIRDLNRVQSETKGLSTASTGLASSFTSLVNPTALIAAGLTAVTAAAVAGAKAIFELTTNAAEYGSTIFDAQSKTGLAAETLSALKVTAEQSGSSFDQVTGAVAKFNVLIGEAKLGNEKAEATLRQYGITARDTNEALEQAVQVIRDETDQTKQAAIAKALFKDRTGEILPVIQALEGGVAKTTQRLKELGVTIDDDAARAADEFGDQMDLLNEQIAAVGRTIGREFLPIFLNMSRSVSNWLAANQGQIKAWATNTADALRGTISLWNQLSAAAVNYYKNSTPSPARSVIAEIGKYNLGSYLRTRGEQERIAQGITGSAGGLLNSTIGGGVSPSGSGGGASRGSRNAGGSTDTDRSAARDLDAQIDIQENKLKDAQDLYETTLKKLRDVFKETGDSKKFIDDASKALEDFTQTTSTTLATLTDLENQQSAVNNATANQVELLRQNQQRRVEAIQAESNASVDKNNELVKDSTARQQQAILDIHQRTADEIARIEERRSDRAINEIKKTLDAEYKALTERAKRGENVGDEIAAKAVEITQFFTTVYQSQLDKRLGQLDREKEARIKEAKDAIVDKKAEQEAVAAIEEEYHQKRLDAEEDFRSRVQGLADEYPIPAIVPTTEEGYQPFQDLLDGFNNFADQVLSRGPQITETLQAIGGLGVAAFESMANAVGNVVQQWVLYGDTGPAVMRKILAAALASLAAEAAVRAIFELALGFASLFFNPAEAAAHFTAAALFGSIAVGAALAGRAVAGDAFKKQAAASTGGASGTSKSSSGSGKQGEAYSDKKDITIDAGRNTPFTQRWEGVLRLQVQSNDSHIVKVVQNDVRGNGSLRTTILNTAEGYG